MGVNLSQLSAFAEKMQHINDELDHGIYDRVLNRLGAQALRKVKLKTPVKEGTLKKNWGIVKFGNSGGVWKVEIFNATKYAPYVEYGHRTSKDGKARWVPGHWTNKGFTYEKGAKTGMLLKYKWIPGKFMLKDSVAEVEKQADGYIQTELKKLFGGAK